MMGAAGSQRLADGSCRVGPRRGSRRRLPGKGCSARTSGGELVLSPLPSPARPSRARSRRTRTAAARWAPRTRCGACGAARRTAGGRRVGSRSPHPPQSAEADGAAAIAPPPTIGELLSIIAADTAEATATEICDGARADRRGGLSFGAVLAIAAVVAVRLCTRRARAPRAGSRRRGYEAASKDAGADEDDDDEPAAGPQFDIEDEDEETTALVGFVIDGDVYLRDDDSGIVYASERDARARASWCRSVGGWTARSYRWRPRPVGYRPTAASALSCIILEFSIIWRPSVLQQLRERWSSEGQIRD